VAYLSVVGYNSRHHAWVHADQARDRARVYMVKAICSTKSGPNYILFDFFYPNFN
jgi:hypothetical protein